MAKPSPSAFRSGIVDRTKRLRERAGLTQADMATGLGVPLERYKKYETRTPLPHELIPRFCVICRITLADFFDVDLNSGANKPVREHRRIRRVS